VKNRSGAATVQDLPGLSYSVGLALLDMGDMSAARGAMASALLRFPVMLEPLLEKWVACRVVPFLCSPSSLRVFPNS
ncbi:unnamed protein product, partial [Discosporangium mesarthrocarpum]